MTPKQSDPQQHRRERTIDHLASDLSPDSDSAQQAAADLGDEKLTDQIGNTITYFTRSHVSRVAEADVDGPDTVTTNIDDVAAAEIGLDESVAFPMWNKIK